MGAEKYLTLGGKRLLQEEFNVLWHQRRPEVVKALHAAAAEGDRSENAEYIYRKKELREIDRRVRFLSRRLADAVVVTSPPADQSKVFFGASVSVVDQLGSVQLLRLVGPDETSASDGCISILSPVAKALLRRQVGDETEVRLPNNRQSLTIQSISYRPEDYK